MNIVKNLLFPSILDDAWAKLTHTAHQLRLETAERTKGIQSCTDSGELGCAEIRFCAVKVLLEIEVGTNPPKGSWTQWMIIHGRIILEVGFLGFSHRLGLQHLALVGTYCQVT